jgi:hypothetical protein
MVHFYIFIGLIWSCFFQIRNVSSIVYSMLPNLILDFTWMVFLELVLTLFSWFPTRSTAIGSICFVSSSSKWITQWFSVMPLRYNIKPCSENETSLSEWVNKLRMETHFRNTQCLHSVWFLQEITLQKLLTVTYKDN